MEKEKFCEKYSWEEFKERYIKWHEEFCFYYHDKKIWLVKDGKNRFLYTSTSRDDVLEKNSIASEIFSSPEELLKNARFEGKRLEDIWLDLV